MVDRPPVNRRRGRDMRGRGEKQPSHRREPAGIPDEELWGRRNSPVWAGYQGKNWWGDEKPPDNVSYPQGWATGQPPADFPHQARESVPSQWDYWDHFDYPAESLPPEAWNKGWEEYYRQDYYERLDSGSYRVRPEWKQYGRNPRELPPNYEGRSPTQYSFYRDMNVGSGEKYFQPLGDWRTGWQGAMSQSIQGRHYSGASNLRNYPWGGGPGYHYSRRNTYRAEPVIRDEYIIDYPVGSFPSFDNPTPYLADVGPQPQQLAGSWLAGNPGGTRKSYRL